MPTRKESVSVPANIARDPRVFQMMLDVACTQTHAVAMVVIALASIAEAGGNAAVVRFGDILGEELAESFKRLFLDNGRCALYDEYNAARDKHRARCRATASKYRGKKAAPKVTPKPEPKASSFDVAWKAYPKRSGGNPRTLAAKAWNARVREGVSEDELVLATKNYAAHCDAENKSGTPYVMQGGTFYGPSQRWRDFMEAPVDAEMDEIMSEIRKNFTED